VVPVSRQVRLEKCLLANPQAVKMGAALNKSAASVSSRRPPENVRRSTQPRYSAILPGLVMAKRITVVVSQGQSQNPAKRALEEEVVAGLLGQRGVDVNVVPHLYDLAPDGTGILCLSGIAGDMIVCSWLYPRAAQWILDRHGVRGRTGTTLLASEEEAESEHEMPADETSIDNEEDPTEPARVADQRTTPDRTIYCLDLRTHDSAEPYLEEIRRIVAEAATETVELMDWIGGSPRPEQLDRYLHPTNNHHDGGRAAADPELSGPGNGTPATAAVVDETAQRRWYPVIDYSRCTNCMECIDFCLFGVYGVDTQETILVEQPDNCRKGCPACSRVCPEQAIIFPQHKSPAIAGSKEGGGALKIDLSQLFGGPDAAVIAASERDEQLVLAGREAVGEGTASRVPRATATASPRDDLDDLMDAVEEMDL